VADPSRSAKWTGGCSPSLSSGFCHADWYYKMKWITREECM
jgi:hypothetical protein